MPEVDQAYYKDMVAVLTGSTSGFGKEVAKLLASKRANVVISGRREEQGQAVAKECNQLGGKAIFVQTDVSDDASCRGLFEAAKQEFGKVTHAFLNAGVFPGGNFVEDETIEDMNNLLAVNVAGTTLSARYAYRAIEASGGKGAVVFTSSVGGSMGNGSGIDVLPCGNSIFCLYTATKSYIDSLVRGCVAYEAKGIKTYAISPSVFISGLNDNKGDDGTSTVVNPLLKNYSGDPKDVAKIVVALMDGSSEWKSGSNVGVEGPFTYNVHERYKIMYEDKNYGTASPPIPLACLCDYNGKPVDVKQEDLDKIVSDYQAKKGTT